MKKTKKAAEGTLMSVVQHYMQADEFVVLWQKAASLEIVAEGAHMTPRAASLRAAYLRKIGVPLKLFKGRNEPLDVKKLTEIAKRAVE